MDTGSPWRRYTSRKNNCATLIVSVVFLQGMKCTILEKRLTTTKIESLPHWVRANSKTKSMLMSTQGWVGTGRGMYNPAFVADPLDT